MKTKIKWEKLGERKFESIFMALVTIFLITWAVVTPHNFSPDEEMRYKVVDYIFRHNALPHGGDPEVMDASWGISYAFYPMLSYMVSYVFMKIVSIFTMNAHAILVAARMAEVLFGVGTAYYTMKIGKHFFKGAYEKMFLCLVTLLPGGFVLFTYINCDSLSLLATAMLIYSWIKGLEDEWSYKSCAFLAVGVSICALSYYNAYGVVLATVLVFCFSILFCEEKKWNFKKMFTRGLFITAIVAVLAGWWFARNYVLYDGDFLGLNITTEYAEQFAEEARKPSNRVTFQENPEANVMTMLFFQPDNHAHNWLLMVYYSFIGCFGYMTIWPPEWIGKVFMVFFLFGVLGVLPIIKNLFSLTKSYFTEKQQICGSNVEVTYKYSLPRWRKEAVFNFGMLAALIMPNIMNIYNSYVNDYQPQGRYCMAMLIPMMYFMTQGYQKLLGRFGKENKAERAVCYGVCTGMVLFLGYCFFVLILPRCIK